MRSSYLFLFLVLVLLHVPSSFSRIKTSKSNKQVPKRTTANVPKANTNKPGQLFYRGKYLPIQFNLTEEFEVYAANYTVFPDELYYRSNRVTDAKEFHGSCVNTTLETNKDKISKLQTGEEVYTRVTMHIIEYLCIKSFESNKSDFCSGALWVITLATAISLLMN